MSDLVCDVKRELLDDPYSREVIQAAEIELGKGIDEILFDEAIQFVSALSAARVVTLEPQARGLLHADLEVHTPTK